MANLSLIESLEQAGEAFCRTSNDELAELLRAAAVRLRNSSIVILDPDVDHAVSELAMENRISKSALLRKIITEWVDANYDDYSVPSVQ